MNQVVSLAADQLAYVRACAAEVDRDLKALIEKAYAAWKPPAAKRARQGFEFRDRASPVARAGSARLYIVRSLVGARPVRDQSRAVDSRPRALD